MDQLYTLSDAQIMQSKKALRRQLLAQEGLTEKKIAILSGSTVGEIKNIYELYLLYHGIKPVFWVGQYNRFYEDALFGDSSLAAFAPDLIYIHTSNKNISVWPEPTDSQDAVRQKLDDCFGRFTAVWDALQKQYACPIIQNNFEPLNYRLFGNNDAVYENGRLHFTERMNALLYDYIREHTGVYVNDIAYLAACYGLDRWADPRYWYLYKYALSTEAIPALCRSVAAITKSIFGKNKKALALDLDHTLWGGVIGDDGIENLQLGIETPTGYAFSDFQQYIKSLASMGVILTVCSKNEEQAARSGFSHPASVLSEEDFVLFQANWKEKSTNLMQAANALNILPDSIVFVDDNPAERDLVRLHAPEITVPELPGDPSCFIPALDRMGYFETTSLSADDLKRNAFYKANFKRQQEALSFADYEDYLRSLHMVCEYSGFQNIARITQLVNKTNQFNPTTRRYTETEIAGIAADGSYITISARLTDQYGDNGIVSALIGHKQDSLLKIDLWVMSCRVFKRQLELAMIDELVRRCQKAGILKIHGFYYPTAKNAFVANLYAQLGFTAVGESVWEFNIPDAYKQKNQVIGVTYHDKRSDPK